MSFTAKKLLVHIVDRFFGLDLDKKEVFVVIFHRDGEGNVTRKDFYPISAIHSIQENMICVECSDKLK